jgi:nucleoside permease NupC
MPVIIFFGAIINLLYHNGIIQYVILKVSWVINSIMGTSPTESMNSTANIFLGQVIILLFLNKIKFN